MHRTALHFAVLCSDTPMVKLLLEKGAEINFKDKVSKTFWFQYNCCMNNYSYLNNNLDEINFKDKVREIIV